MKNRNATILVAVIVALLLLAGQFLEGGLFYSAKYYNTAQEAFEADGPNSPVIGPVRIESSLGNVALGGNTELYLAKAGEQELLVAVMDVKDDRYTYRGSYALYDLSLPDDLGNDPSYTVQHGSQTKTDAGAVEWFVVYSRETVEALDKVKEIKPFLFSEEREIYLVIME